MVQRFARNLPRLALIGALAAVTALAACGRKGPLELPPDAQSAPAPAPAATLPEGAPPLTTEEASPLAPPGQPRRLPLDWLLD